MSKSNLPRIFTILLVVLLSFTSLAILNVKAQTYTEEGPSTLQINIESPENKIYNQNSILINVTFHTQPGETRDSYVAYSILDENAKYTSGLLYDGRLSKSEPIWRSTVIEEIPDGEYTLRVTGRHWIEPRGIQEADQDFVDFIINVNPPEITILSPENIIYYTNNINLTCQYTEEIIKASYCLNQNKNVTFTKHIILEDLSAGEHELIVYAKDLAGKVGVSEITYFTIMEPFPTTQVLVITIAVIVGLGILVYSMRKRRT